MTSGTPWSAAELLALPLLSLGAPAEVEGPSPLRAVGATDAMCDRRNASKPGRDDLPARATGAAGGADLAGAASRGAGGRPGAPAGAAPLAEVGSAAVLAHAPMAAAWRGGAGGASLADAHSSAQALKRRAGRRRKGAD
jgi:hypothetical protein